MSSAAPSACVARVLGLLDGVKRSGREWKARCPAHDDHDPSLSIDEGDDGKALLTCRAGCENEKIAAAIGLTMADLFPPGNDRAISPIKRTQYKIRNLDGSVAAIHERLDFPPPKPKQCIWRRPDGRLKLPDHVKPCDLPLYGVEKLRDVPIGTGIVVTEGEPACDSLTARGVRAVGSVTGASGMPSDESLRPLLGYSVALWPDNDTPGHAHMLRIGARLVALGHTDVRIVSWPDAPPKGDAADYRADDLHALLDAALPYHPSPAPETTVEHDPQLDAEIRRQRTQREAKRIIDAETRGPVTLPNTPTLRDWLTEPDPAVLWRIESWQPTDSRVLLTAPFKGGKTISRDNLLRSLVDGDPWLGGYAVHVPAGTVAVWDVEMSTAQLRMWLREQQITNDDKVIIVPLRGQAASLDLLNPAVRAAWVQWLRERGVVYLILDCLRPVLDALGLDEQHEAGRFLVAFDALLAEAGITEALVIHHHGHGAERSRGDSRLRDWPDVEWKIVRQDNDNPASPRFISAYGRDVDIPESRLDYNLSTRRLTLAGGSRRDQEVAHALDDVLAVLQAATAPLSKRQIETACEAAGSEHGRDNIRKAIAVGIKQGFINTEPGPRRAVLHRTGRVRGSARLVRENAASECADDYRSPHTRTLLPDNPSARPFDPREAFGPRPEGQS